MKAKPKKSQAPVIAESPDSAQQKAIRALSPSVSAAVITCSYSLHGDVDLGVLYDLLSDQCRSVHGGDLKRAESMLIAQAHSLDAIFTNLARRASLNLGAHIDAAEIYLKLALKAQSQCRATVEALAAIKNPPVVFAKQANIAHGPQQVNNGMATEPTRAEEKATPPTELLEHDHGQRLDTGTARAAGAGDPVMATVGTINRAAHRERKGRSKP